MELFSLEEKKGRRPFGMELHVSAPGKVILHGEHSVVYGKRAIAGSVSLRTTVKIRTLDLNQVTLDFSELNVKENIDSADLSKLESSLSGSLDELNIPSEDVKNTLTCLQLKDSSLESMLKQQTIFTAICLFCYLRKISGKQIGVDIVGQSNLPIGAGLGSSASFSACLSAGLLTLFGFVQRPECSEKESMGFWSKQDLEVINKWAYFGEKIIHGTPSGVDNSVATFGGAIRFQKGIISPLEFIPQMKILLINTKIPRSTKKLVGLVRERKEKNSEIYEPILQSMDEITNAVVKTYGEICNNDVGPQSSAFSNLEELIDVNQHLLQALGVSHPALDDICLTCIRSGFHAKLTGAGGGGCAYCVIRPDVSEESLEALKLEMIKRDFDCWECTLGGPGVAMADR